MKKVSTDNNIRNKGFTLVELLAVIAILSVIITIVIYTATNVVNNAKEKSYQVTINNIEEDARNYALEDLSIFTWIDITNSSYQYQCITVQNLIEAGYFKSDVLDSYISKDRKVSTNDYIYLERNSDSKTITKNVLLIDERYHSLCENISAIGNIYFDINPSGWSKEKNINIRYKIYNVTDISSNNYNYSFYEINYSDNFTNNNEEEGLNVKRNGTLYATIKDSKGNIIVSDILVVSKIDNIKPFGSIIQSSNNKTINLTIGDNESGVSKYYFGMSNPENTEVTWTNIQNVNNKRITTNITKSGTWYLGIQDAVGNTNIISENLDNAQTYTITYEANGGYSSSGKNNQYCSNEFESNHDVTGTMTTQTCTIGEPCTLNTNTYVRQCHLFMGWTTKTDTDSKDYTNLITGDDDTDAFYADGDTFIYNGTKNITLYAVWKSNHNFNAIGNQLFEAGSISFTCGFVHEDTGAYNRYCSKCQMSAGHYKSCYKPSYTSEPKATKFCPCCAKNISVTFDDHKTFNASGSANSKISNTDVYEYGGIIEGATPIMDVVGYGMYAPIICTDHNPKSTTSCH